MKRVLLMFVLLAVWVPGLSQAQDTTCPGCVIGVYDEPELVHNFGTWDINTDGPQKSFYVGVKYDPGSSFDGLTGVELSVSGLPPTFLTPSIKILDDGFGVGNTLLAPPDTTVVGADGGQNITWSQCMPGNRALIEISLATFDALPQDVVIRVLRRFPSTTPELPNVLFTMCDSPIYTKVVSTGGCYVLNPSGNPVECTLPVSPSTWTRVKQLYR